MNRVRPSGSDEAAPGLMSLSFRVPSVVPSVTHNSRSSDASTAENTATPPTSTNSFGNPEAALTDGLISLSFTARCACAGPAAAIHTAVSNSARRAKVFVFIRSLEVGFHPPKESLPGRFRPGKTSVPRPKRASREAPVAPGLADSTRVGVCRPTNAHLVRPEPRTLGRVRVPYVRRWAKSSQQRVK